MTAPPLFPQYAGLFLSAILFAPQHREVLLTFNNFGVMNVKPLKRKKLEALLAHYKLTVKLPEE